MTKNCLAPSCLDSIPVGLVSWGLTNNKIKVNVLSLARLNLHLTKPADPHFVLTKVFSCFKLFGKTQGFLNEKISLRKILP